MQQPKSQETAINENNQNTDLNQETKQSNQEEYNNDHGDSQDQQMVQSKVSNSKINDSKIQQQNNEKTDQNDLQVSKGIEFQEEQNQNNQSNIQVKQELEQIDNSSLSFGKAPQTTQENKQQNSDNSNQNEQILASIKKQQSQSSKISTTKQLNQKSNVIEQNSEGQEQINDHGQQQSSKISKITKSNVKEQNPESQEDNNSSQQIQEGINKNQDGADNVDKNQQIQEQQITDVKEEQIIDQGSKLDNEEQENNQIEQIEQIEQSEQNELNKDTIPKELTSEERSKLRERFLMDLARPKIKKHKNENDKDYQSFTELPIDIARLPRKKSAIQHQILSKSPPKKQNTQIKRRIIQDLKDFKENNYKVLTEEQKIQKRQQLEEQEQMQQNDKQIIETPPLDEKQRKIESLKKDLKRFEQTKEIREVKKETQLNQSEVKVNKNQSKGGKKKNKKSPSKSEKKQMSKSPEIKVVYTEVKRKIEIKNDIRSRIQINKDEGKNKEAIEFVRKMQRLRHESESKKNKELENIGQKIQQGIDKYKTSNQVAKLMIIKEKRKKALESITNQEKKRLDIMSKQQMNLKFVQELKKKADYLGHYSVKKLSYPMQMITELDNGQIQLQDMIDTNRKLNEKQFLSIEEQKQQKLELVKKQQDYGKQVSLLHFPKVNLQKQDYHETIDEQPVIKKKQKKAWQIEQELQQKQNLDSSQLK